MKMKCNFREKAQSEKAAGSGFRVDGIQKPFFSSIFNILVHFLPLSLKKMPLSVVEAVGQLRNGTDQPLASDPRLNLLPLRLHFQSSIGSTTKPASFI